MKKGITIVVAILLILGIGFYLKTQSSYDLVQNEIERQKKDHHSDENQNPTNTQEENQNSEEGPFIKPIEDFNRSVEDIAMDKRIKDQRLKNEENYKKSGITGSLEAGKGLAPKRTLEDIASVLSTLENHRDTYPEIYAKGGEDLITGKITIDPRFEELIWGEAKEERKGLLEGHKDEDLFMMELKRLDGEYDEVFLVRDPDSGEWSVVYVGNYYDFKEKVQ